MKIIIVLAACLAFASASPYPFRTSDRQQEAYEQAAQGTLPPPPPPPPNSRDLDYFLPGRTITLFGYAPKTGKFQVNLVPVYGGPYVLDNAICLRLDVDLDTYHITRSSLAHSHDWFAAEDEGYTGLLPGRFFTIHIIVQMYSYEILVNGYHFTTYYHRIPFTKTMRIEIGDNVRAEPVEYY